MTASKIIKIVISAQTLNSMWMTRNSREWCLEAGEQGIPAQHLSHQLLAAVPFSLCEQKYCFYLHLCKKFQLALFVLKLQSGLRVGKGEIWFFFCNLWLKTRYTGWDTVTLKHHLTAIKNGVRHLHPKFSYCLCWILLFDRQIMPFRTRHYI